MACSGACVVLWWVFVVLAASIGGIASEEYTKDRVVRLPGQPKVGFGQYAGYVDVDRRDGRALFYWLTEAFQHSHSKPLVLWLNGGPGCSSIAYGASEEIGPFRINKTGTGLYLNPFAWNKLANLLFLESPAGVGFSYTNTSSNLEDTGDARTAEDSFVFLLNWFQRFPHYRHRDFYITGESYAGHYVPQLVKKIYDYNKKHPANSFINLKGFMVGNAVTDDFYDNLGTVHYWWSHAMISDETYRSILKHCNFRNQKNSDKCSDLLQYATDHEFGKIDQYSIYTLPCPQPQGNRQALRFRFNKSLLKHISGYDPCTENYAEKYYNRPDVQEALHANVTKIRYRWTGCSDALLRNWNDTDFSVLPIYRELIQANASLRIWVYSGDVDSIVPVTATRFSLGHLRLPIKTRWYPWYSDDQVGGWTEIYEGLTFATIRGAGHEVPLLRPKPSFDLFKWFLSGKPLPPQHH